MVGKVTFVRKSMTNKCKFQRKKRTWCVLRIKRRPVVNTGGWREMYHKARTSNFLASCIWLGQWRQSLNLWTDLASCPHSSLVFSTQMYSSLGLAGEGFWAFPECFIVEKLSLEAICNKMGNGLSFFLFPWELHGKKHFWGAERICLFLDSSNTIKYHHPWVPCEAIKWLRMLVSK